jgi:hypothetical protein
MTILVVVTFFFFCEEHPRSIIKHGSTTHPQRNRKLQTGPWRSRPLQPPTRSKDAPPHRLRRSLLEPASLSPAISTRTGSRHSRSLRTSTTEKKGNGAPPGQFSHQPARERKIQSHSTCKAELPGSTARTEPTSSSRSGNQETKTPKHGRRLRHRDHARRLYRPKNPQIPGHRKSRAPRRGPEGHRRRRGSTPTPHS